MLVLSFIGKIVAKQFPQRVKEFKFRNFRFHKTVRQYTQKICQNADYENLSFLKRNTDISDTCKKNGLLFISLHIKHETRLGCHLNV
jgi:hypothetical protein